ncbi:hypothetical protein PG988_007336 [Apiospora saccharicola]
MRVVYILERDDVSGIGVSSYARQISATRKPRIDCVGEVLVGGLSPACDPFSTVQSTNDADAERFARDSDFVVYEDAAHYGDDCALWLA